MTDLERKLALLKKLREREQAGEPTAEKQPKIPPVDRSQPIPLAYGQERIWLLDRLAPGKNAFNMPCSMRLIGDLDTDALLGAVRAVIAHHEAMRTTFAEVDGLPRQIIRDAEWIEVPVEDLRSLPEDERQRRAHDAWNDVTNAPFDLDGGPLYRARIVRVADDEHHLLQTIHHIVSDGWSLDVLLRDLGECLKATRSGETPRLEPLPIQYVDFVAWQKERLRGETLDAMIRYWREQLDGAPQSLALPTDRPRPAVSANLGVFLESRLPTTLIDRLEAIARSERTSLYMVLLAGFAILMSRLAGQDDVLIGSPNAGRDQIETERLIGFFLNTLVLRCQVDPTADFSTLLAQVRSTVLGANENQDIPFEKLLEELQPERNLSQNPFFQVLFNMVNLPDSEADLQDLTIEGLGVEGIDSKFDLTFYIQEAPTSRGGGHYVHLSYDAELFDRARMTELLSQYARLLEQVAVDPRRAIGAVSLVTESAREVLPDPTAPLDDAWRGTIAAAMAGHAAEHPDAPAVIDVTGKVSFAETTARSGRIARSLIDAG
ncbi:MAG: condensation domain-containing protein, partial [Acidobacteriota bacterium]